MGRSLDVSSVRLATKDMCAETDRLLDIDSVMDTIEPPSFCPSLGFTAASSDAELSVGVVRGLFIVAILSPSFHVQLFGACR